MGRTACLARLNANPQHRSYKYISANTLHCLSILRTTRYFATSIPLFLRDYSVHDLLTQLPRLSQDYYQDDPEAFSTSVGP